MKELILQDGIDGWISKNNIKYIQSGENHYLHNPFETLIRSYSSLKVSIAIIHLSFFNNTTNSKFNLSKRY